MCRQFSIDLAVNVGLRLSPLGPALRLASASLRRRGLRRGIEDKTKLGRHLWVVERILSWLLRFKCLGLRYDRTEATLRPLLLLAVSIINLRRLVQRES